MQNPSGQQIIRVDKVIADAQIRDASPLITFKTHWVEDRSLKQGIEQLLIESKPRFRRRLSGDSADVRLGLVLKTNSSPHCARGHFPILLRHARATDWRLISFADESRLNSRLCDMA